MSTKIQFCTEDGSILKQQEDKSYVCEKCGGKYILHDNTQTIKIDDDMTITTGDIFLIKIN